jgi:hypothetical protein
MRQILTRPERVTIEPLRIRGAPAFRGRTTLSDGRPQGELHARGELRDSVRARGYRDHAAESLELARNASNPDVKNRYVTIAQHYLTLAEAEERSADQKSVERRSRAAC